MPRRYQDDASLYGNYPDYGNMPSAPSGGLLSFNQMSPTYFGRPVEEIGTMMQGMDAMNTQMINQYDKIDFALNTTEVMPEDGQLLLSAKEGLRKDIDDIASSEDYSMATAKLRFALKRNYLNNYDLQKAATDKIKYEEYIKSAEALYRSGGLDHIQYQDRIERPYIPVSARKDPTTGVVTELPTDLGAKKFDSEAYILDLVSKYNPDVIQSISESRGYMDPITGKRHQPTQEEILLGLSDYIDSYSTSQQKYGVIKDKNGNPIREGLNAFLEDNIKSNPEALAYFEDIARIHNKKNPNAPTDALSLITAKVTAKSMEEALSNSQTIYASKIDNGRVDWERQEESARRSAMRKAALTADMSAAGGFNYTIDQTGGPVTAKGLKTSYEQTTSNYDNAGKLYSAKASAAVLAAGGTKLQADMYSDIAYVDQLLKNGVKDIVINGTDVLSELRPYLASYEYAVKEKEVVDNYIAAALDNAIKANPDKSKVVVLPPGTPLKEGDEYTYVTSDDPGGTRNIWDLFTIDYNTSGTYEKRPTKKLTSKTATTTKESMDLYSEELDVYLKATSQTPYVNNIQFNNVAIAGDDGKLAANMLKGIITSQVQGATVDRPSPIKNVRTGEVIATSQNPRPQNKTYALFDNINQLDINQIYTYAEGGKVYVAFKPISSTGTTGNPLANTKNQDFYSLELNQSTVGVLASMGFYNTADLQVQEALNAVTSNPVVYDAHSRGNLSLPINGWYPIKGDDGKVVTDDNGVPSYGSGELFQVRLNPGNGSYAAIMLPDVNKKGATTTVFVPDQGSAIKEINKYLLQAFKGE